MVTKEKLKEYAYLIQHHTGLLYKPAIALATVYSEFYPKIDENEMIRKASNTVYKNSRHFNWNI